MTLPQFAWPQGAILAQTLGVMLGVIVVVVAGLWMVLAVATALTEDGQQ